MQDFAAVDERVDHIAQACLLLEEIFASLDLAAIAFGHQRDIEQKAVLDHAFAFELGNDLMHLRARRDQHDLVGLERTGCGNLLLRIGKQGDGADGGNQQERQEAAECGERRTPAARRRHLRRRWRILGLQRFLGRAQLTAAKQAGRALDLGGRILPSRVCRIGAAHRSDRCLVHVTRVQASLMDFVAKW